MAFVYAWIVPMGCSTPTTAFDIEHMHEKVYNFFCTDSAEIFSKQRSAGLNYNLPSFFFTDSYCAGGI